MTTRIVDDHGAAWPITGDRCTRCRLPLDPVLAGVGTHPGCGPGSVLPAAAYAHLLAALVRVPGAQPVTDERRPAGMNGIRSTEGVRGPL